VSWTSVTGATTYKIFNKATSGAYANSKIQSSPVTDDVLDNAWSQATTITPTSGAAPISGRFDYATSNSATANAQLTIVDTTGSGTRYSKISFGIATDSATEPTYQSHIYSRSDNSYLHAATPRFVVIDSAGGTETVTLGNSNELNKNKSATDTTKIWSSYTSHPAIQVDNNSGAIGIYNSFTGTNESIVIGQRTGAHRALLLRLNSAPTQDLFTWQNSVGGILGGITTTGALRAPAGASVSALGLQFQGNTTSGFWSVTTSTIGIAAGGGEIARWNTVGFAFRLSAAATDYVHIGAGSTSLAPLRFTTGSLTTGANIRAGQVQFLTDKLHFTITTGTAVKEITLNDTVLTSGRVPIVTTNGRLTDLAAFTYATNRLSPTYITLAAGTATAGTCPLVFTSGTLLATAIAGGQEFLTDKFYGTITTGAARKEFTLNDIALTSGRLALVTTNGRLTDLSTITYSAGVITATGFTGALNGTLGATTPSSAIVTSLQADSITNDTGLAAGVWTPTRSAEANMDANVTMFEGQYMRVGNTVTCSGRFTADPTLTATATSFESNLKLDLIVFSKNCCLVSGLGMPSIVSKYPCRLQKASKSL